ncbi:MAG TPA: HAD family hydrolase [Oligoflexia bacterium]|nr:HAD family hydrolase [Oligoflexia bacterium]
MKTKKGYVAQVAEIAGCECMIPFKPELVIFDLDGTLVHFPHDYLFRETNRILEELTWPPVEEAVLEETFSLFDYFSFIEEDKRVRFQEHFWQAFDHKNYPAPVPFTGSVKCLQTLSDLGISIAIATARAYAEEELQAALAGTGILDFIDVLVPRRVQDRDWMDKSGQIQEICQRLDVSTKKSVMVGDIPPDITSASEAGVGFTVAVLSGGIREEILRRAAPDLVVENVDELINYFLSI